MSDWDDFMFYESMREDNEGIPVEGDPFHDEDEYVLVETEDVPVEAEKKAIHRAGQPTTERDAREAKKTQTLHAHKENSIVTGLFALAVVVLIYLLIVWAIEG